MADIYLALLILGCIACLGWGLDKMSRLYQYPFFMAGMFIAYLVPQAVALFLNPALLPSQKALERMLLMSALCIFMCLASILFPVPLKQAKLLSMPLNLKRLFRGGVVLSTIGFVFTILASRTAFSRNEIGQATGIGTILSTFTYVSIPGLAMVLIVALKQPKLLHYWAIAFAAIVPVYRIVFLGRRETTAAFLMTVGLALFFQKRITVPRPIAIGVIAFALLAIPLIGQYRTISAAGDWDQLWQLNPLETFQEMVVTSDDLELKYAALSMDATVETQQYGYGLGYWNELVFRFVPGQWVGSDFKEGLMLRSQTFSLNDLYGYVPNPGFVMSGVGDAFMEFDYLGCFIFLGFGYLCKVIWASAVRFDSLSSQLVYISSIPGLLKIVSHGTQSTVADITFTLVFVFGVFLYARQPVRSSAALKSSPSIY